MGILSKLFGKRIEKTEETGEIVPWKLTPVEARMRAGLMVKSAAKLGVQLDYSPESLAAIDMLIAKERETGVGLTKEMQFEMVSLGAYVGEVLVRHLDAKWVRGSGQPVHDPLLILVDCKYAVNAVSIVFRRFVMGEPHSVVRMYEETRRMAEGQ
jgi:hypothetical protein